MRVFKPLALGLRSVAASSDGKVPEIIQHERFENVLGIQGHP